MEPGLKRRGLLMSLKLQWEIIQRLDPDFEEENEDLTEELADLMVELEEGDEERPSGQMVLECCRDHLSAGDYDADTYWATDG